MIYVAIILGFLVTLTMLFGLCCAAKRGDEKLAEWNREQGRGPDA